MGITKNILTTLFFFCCLISSGQNLVKGKVIDSLQTPIPYVNVLLKNIDGKIVTYAYTNESGDFKLDIEKKGIYTLNINALSFKAFSEKITFNEQVTEINKNIQLIATPFELNEVILKADKPIIVKKDTIEISVKSFLKGNEKVVEDLLKNIPGIEVDELGTIKIEGKEVEKVMVEDDDFFDKGYRVLTKNMPAQPIEKIEVLKNYSNNKHLKGVEQSEKIALNLKLKEDAKRVWFGNADIGYGVVSENRYSVNGNLMNFGKKNKYFFLTNFNNTGYDATGNINYLVNPNNTSEAGEIGGNEFAYRTMYFENNIPNFKQERTNFNNNELLSLNSIFNPTTTLKIKPLLFLNTNEKSFDKSTNEFVNIAGTNFFNNEKTNLDTDYLSAFAKLDVFYDLSNRTQVKSILKYNYQNEDQVSGIDFNSDKTTALLNTENKLFDQKISLTSKITDNKVLLVSERFKTETIPQNFHLDNFWFQDLFSSNDAVNTINQFSSNKMNYMGVNVHYLNRKANKDLFETQVGYNYRQDKFTTVLNLLNDNELIETPNGFQNNTKLTTNDFYAKTKYQITKKKWSFIGNLDFHLNKNSLLNSTQSEGFNFYVVPKLGFNWKLNKNNNLSGSYRYNTTNSNVLNVVDNYYLTSLHSFTKSDNGFNQLNSSLVFLNYTLGNWGSTFFANFIASYTKDYDFFSTNTQISQNYSLSEKILFKDKKQFFLNSDINYFFDAISSNLKFNFGYSNSDYKNIVDNTQLIKVDNYSYNYGLELKTNLKGMFDFSLGHKWFENKVKTNSTRSFSNNSSFLNIYARISEKMNLSLLNERYYFGNLETDNSYYFSDLSVNYEIQKGKINLSLTGKNLLDTNEYKNVFINEYGSSVSSYRLLPRYFLLSANFRF